MTYRRTAAWLRPWLWLGWPGGAFAWCVWATSLTLGGCHYDLEGSLIGGDHLAFYAAARQVRDGQSGRMYDYSTPDPADSLGVYQGSLIGRPDWGTLIGFRNPPFYALLYVPTARLPYPASVAVWWAVGLAILVGSIHLLRPPRPWRWVLRALAFFPVFTVVSFGQNSFLSLGAFTAVYLLAARGRGFAAGLVGGLLWFKPPLLLGLFVWWGLNPVRHARSWAGVVVTGVLLAAVSWLVIPDGARAFVDSLSKNVGYGGEAGWNKQSPRAFWTLLLPDAPPAVKWGLIGVTAAAGLGAGAWVARRTGAPVAAMFPVAVFLSLWLSPHALIYEWAILVPAAVVLWTEYPGRRDAWVCLFTAAWVALTFSTIAAKGQIDHLPAGSPVVQFGVPVMGWVGWRVARELVRVRPGADHAGAPDGHAVGSANLTAAGAGATIPEPTPARARVLPPGPAPAGDPSTAS
ncbi:MAG: DUF2029 domain-containing protein [Gemmataceae bacterium]|nr:DUF2029 domain-containing protein [Gemmataceae bacterium]